MEMKQAVKPLGLTLKWDQSEVTDPSKHVYLGSVVKGVLISREEFMDAQRAIEKKAPAIIYKIKLDDGSFISVWETKLIRDQMEEGNGGGPIPVGAVVEFHHKGRKQGKNKTSRPYHVIEILFGIPSVKMNEAAPQAQTMPSAITAPPAKSDSTESGGW